MSDDILDVEIALDRCVCIHSISQIVDIVLQVLLYQRRLIPEPVQNLLVDSAQNSIRFKDVYQEVSETFLKQ